MNSKYVHSFEGTSPILLEMPHSGRIGLQMPNDIPSVLAKKVRFLSKAVRQTIGFGCDSAVPDMSGFAHLLAVSKLSGVSNDLARVYCDTNRSKTEVSDWAVEDKDHQKNHHGIIWARTVLTGLDLSFPTGRLEIIVDRLAEKMLKSPLSADEFQELMSEVYDPYHEAIQHHHKRIIEKHGFCIHLALHSMAPLSVTKVYGGYVCGQKATRGSFDLEKNTLPDVILIHNNFASADKVLVQCVRDAFESAGLIVEDGQGPFLGNIGVTKLYGDPKRGINIIGIEHVSHDIEPERHLGNPAVDTGKALALQPVYKAAIENLLHE